MHGAKVIFTTKPCATAVQRSEGNWATVRGETSRRAEEGNPGRDDRLGHLILGKAMTGEPPLTT